MPLEARYAWAFKTTPQLSGVEPRRRGQQGGVAGRQRRRLPPRRWGWTNRGPWRKPWAAVQLPDGLRERQVLRAPEEVQHVAPQSAAKAVEPLGVGIHRETAFNLFVKGADALADPAPSSESYAGGLHNVAKGMSRLQGGDVDRPVRYDHDAPPVRGRRPRRLRWETILPGRQRMPRAATTSSIPPARVARAAARPVPWL